MLLLLFIAIAAAAGELTLGANAMLLILFLALAAATGELTLVVRPRSRHTYSFQVPFHELALFELESLSFAGCLEDLGWDDAPPSLLPAELRRRVRPCESVDLAVFSSSVLLFGIFADDSLVVRGLAAPRGERLVYPSVDAHRRPDAGLLKNFRLASLVHRAKTSMEPELALLMANFARVGPRKSVMDPFCGAGILLVAAALQGATRLEGSDAASVDEEGVRANLALFPKQLSLPVILSLRGDMPISHLLSAAEEEEVDCIVTDPPYGLGAPIIGSGGLCEDVMTLLLRLAERRLKDGGRLVCWAPQRVPLLAPSSCLRLVKTFEQVLSPTYSRHLCVFEKCEA
jgi:16S rRNA G966 N2-methylase RsmD